MPDYNFILNYKLKNKIKSNPNNYDNSDDIIEKIRKYLKIENLDILTKNISVAEILKNKKSRKIHAKLKNIF